MDLEPTLSDEGQIARPLSPTLSPLARGEGVRRTAERKLWTEKGVRLTELL